MECLDRMHNCIDLICDYGYFKREEDNFGVCNFELFKKLYKARDLNTLAKSRITNVLPIVLDFANDYIKQHGAKRTPNIYINTYIQEQNWN